MKVLDYPHKYPHKSRGVLAMKTRKPMRETKGGDASEQRSRWNEAIVEAKAKIVQIKQSVKLFESMRDSGMDFPEPKQGSKRRKVAA